MKNRDWLNNMAMIDRFNLMIKHSLDCPLSLIGVPMSVTNGRCKKYGLDCKTINDVCYGCVSAWLNEEKELGK